MKRNVRSDFFIDSNHELLTFMSLSGLNLSDGAHVDLAWILLPNLTLTIKSIDGVPKRRKNYKGLSEDVKFCETFIIGYMKGCKSINARLSWSRLTSSPVDIIIITDGALIRAEEGPKVLHAPPTAHMVQSIPTLAVAVDTLGE